MNELMEVGAYVGFIAGEEELRGRILLVLKGGYTEYAVSDAEGKVHWVGEGYAWSEAYDAGPRLDQGGHDFTEEC
jgi:hypothetical protein